MLRNITIFNFSRIPARIVIEIAKPTAEPKPFTILSRIVYSFCTFESAIPRTAQFVVIREGILQVTRIKTSYSSLRTSLQTVPVPLLQG